MTTTPPQIRKALRTLSELGTLDEFETQWMTALENPDEQAMLVEILPEIYRALEGTDRGTRQRAQELIVMLLDKLEEDIRWEEALAVVMASIAGGGDLPEGRAKMRDLIAKTLEGDPRGALILARIDLTEDSRLPLREAVEVYQRLARWQIGAPVFHSAGWNEGTVAEILPEDQAVVVQYAGGNRQTIKFEHAVSSRSLQILDEDDLRAMRMRDREGLHQLAREDPCAVLRKVAMIHLNKATTPIIKDELYERVIPRSEWTAWWKAARAAAIEDPYLQAEGSPTRPTFLLREKPLSLDGEAKERVGHALSLSEAIQRTRNYVKLGISDETREELFDLVRKVATRDEDMLRSSDPAQLLECALYLEKEGTETISLKAREIFEEVKDDPERMASLLGGLSSVISRRDALSQLAEDLPEEWKAILIGALPRLPGEIAEAAVEKLSSAGAHAELRGALSRILRSPERAPYPLFALLKVFFSGRIPIGENGHGKGELMIAALRLAVTVESRRREIAKAGTLLRSIIQLVHSKGTPLFEAASQAELEGMMTVCMMPALHAELRTIVQDVYERLHIEEEGGSELGEAFFWESDRIFCTEEGIARLAEEVRILREVKIPDNTEAIQRAASHGDLSENAEWDAAMEEQRQLTTKADELSRQLERCSPLERQAYREGVASPGCKVRYIELDSGLRREVFILGPWDTGEEKVISYKAPLAGAMLGHGEGDRLVVDLPGGRQEIRIEKVENAVLFLSAGSDWDAGS